MGNHGTDGTLTATATGENGSGENGVKMGQPELRDFSASHVRSANSASWLVLLIAKRTPRVGAEAPRRGLFAVGVARLWLLAERVNVPSITGLPPRVYLIESKRSGNRERGPIHHIHPRVRRNQIGRAHV